MNVQGPATGQEVIFVREGKSIGSFSNYCGSEFLEGMITKIDGDPHRVIGIDRNVKLKGLMQSYKVNIYVERM